MKCVNMFIDDSVNLYKMAARSQSASFIFYISAIADSSDFFMFSLANLKYRICM